MGKLYYEDPLNDDMDDFVPPDDAFYREPNSIHLSEDWDTLMEDFLDDFEDYTDVDFPTPDDDF